MNYFEKWTNVFQENDVITNIIRRIDKSTIISIVVGGIIAPTVGAITAELIKRHLEKKE